MTKSYSGGMDYLYGVNGGAGGLCVRTVRKYAATRRARPIRLCSGQALRVNDVV
ncbi:MAG: hypothetical protein K8R02_00705 [Anaerohalosphaeraceae bacterium]|nr:hypothetical protein [Anaerohalosphaeraceae bacterium]